MKEESGKIRVYDEHGKPSIDIEGTSTYGVEVLKKYKEEKKISIGDSFSEIQKAKMFRLSSEDKKILDFVRDFFQEHNKYPTPTQIKRELNLEHVNRITRKINDLKGSLRKYLVFEGGKHKGKKVCFTKEFQDDKLL